MQFPRNRVSVPVSNKVNGPIENRVSAPVTDEVYTSATDRLNAPIRCYGCGKQEVVRSRYETCNSDKYVDFNYSDDIHRTPHPTLMVNICGREGVPIIDTGATHCVASPSLHAIRDVLTAEVPITIEERDFSAHFMVLPGDDTRTLLGFDFLSKASLLHVSTV